MVAGVNGAARDDYELGSCESFRLLRGAPVIEGVDDASMFGGVESAMEAIGAMYCPSG